MHEDTATILFGIPGLRVVDADVELDGGLTIYAVTADPTQITCPGCGGQPRRSKGVVVTTARDAALGGQPRTLRWIKRRWTCPTPACSHDSFTESLPATPRRARITTRLRHQLALAVADSGRDVTEVATSHRVAWHTTHQAFVAHVDPGLQQPPTPVRVLGIDEIRRGRPRLATDPTTGATITLADRWHTGFTDLTGDQGILGHVEGRARADVVGWLRAQPADWRAGIELVATDLCAAFRAAVRTVLPHAALCADPFHLVQCAVRRC